MYFKPRGSVTVFICIILAALIPLSMILIDLCRYRLAVKQVETALKTCGESMLAAYDRQLREQYGLMALYPRDEANMNKEIFELLSENLNEGSSIAGTSDLYGFKVRKVEAIPFYNYTETFVMDQQVAEFMKYRAPIQVVQEFVEKIKVMVGLMKESDMVEKKMSLDKLMNDIRGSLVNVHYMINEKLGGLNPASDSSTLKDKTISTVKDLVQKAAAEMESANNEIEPIAAAKAQYVQLYPAYEQAKKNSDAAETIKNSISRDIEEIEKKLAKLRTERNNTTGSAINALNNSISSLESDLIVKKESYAKAEESFKAAYQITLERDSEISPSRNELQIRLPKVIQNLSNTLGFHESLSQSLNAFIGHLNVYILYHNDLIKLIGELEPKLDELEKQSQNLLSETTSTDSAVSDKIQADLAKQLRCIKKETFTSVKNQLSSNLQKLETWKKALANYATTVTEATEKIKVVHASAVAFKEELHNEKKVYTGYREYTILPGMMTVEGSLSDLKAQGQLQGVYDIPAYALEPSPSPEETKAFKKWFNQKYEGAKAESEPTGDDSEIKKIRGSVGDFAQVTGALGNEESTDEEKPKESGSTIMEVIKRVNTLPTIMGAKSSHGALKRIGKSITESAQNQAVTNPLDTPVQGIEKVDEKEKNFFDYEIERISNLMSLIKNALANGMEGLMESLYMNEYIVSAFKNTATGDLLEYDIGWDRPLDQTYFDDAEVEYILFGHMRESENIGATQRSIFAIRLVFNLLHVYTDPQKVGMALSLASAIAGWTVFGVPVVQNFLLVAWAGLESYVDSEILKKGGSVPLIKTSSSWYLKAESLVDFKGILLKKIKDFAVEKMEALVDDASEAIEETVMGIINGVVDEAFSGIEEAYNQLTSEVFEFTDEQVNALVGTELLPKINFDSLDTFKESLEQGVKNKIVSIKDQIKGYVPEKLAAFKEKIKTKVRDFIFESDEYKTMIEKLKKAGTNLINKGLQAAEDKIDSVLGKAGGSNSNNITGKLIMMDYTDYLRLLLLSLPQETKALRAADLMQLNMQNASGKKDLMLNEYNTYLYIKAEVDFNPWFLPEDLFKKDGAAMISVQWSQGY